MEFKQEISIVITLVNKLFYSDLKILKVMYELVVVLMCSKILSRVTEKTKQQTFLVRMPVI